MLIFEDYKLKKNYPHLIGADMKLWDKFIRVFPKFFEKVVYDVHLGEGVAIPSDMDPKFTEMVKTLTQKRVDVVGVNNTDLTIVEVKTYAGTTAVGQLLLYRFLFQKYHPNWKVIQLLLITDILQPDMQDFCNQYEIQVVELGMLK